MWGLTYIVTTELLPPDRPLFTGAVRALSAGALVVLRHPGVARGRMVGQGARARDPQRRRVLRVALRRGLPVAGRRGRDPRRYPAAGGGGARGRARARAGAEPHGRCGCARRGGRRVVGAARWRERRRGRCAGRTGGRALDGDWCRAHKALGPASFAARLHRAGNSWPVGSCSYRSRSSEKVRRRTSRAPIWPATRGSCSAPPSRTPCGSAASAGSRLPGSHSSRWWRRSSQQSPAGSGSSSRSRSRNCLVPRSIVTALVMGQRPDAAAGGVPTHAGQRWVPSPSISAASAASRKPASTAAAVAIRN